MLQHMVLFCLLNHWLPHQFYHPATNNETQIYQSEASFNWVINIHNALSYLYFKISIRTNSYNIFRRARNYSFEKSVRISQLTYETCSMVLLLMCLWRCVYVFQINYGVIFLFSIYLWSYSQAYLIHSQTSRSRAEMHTEGCHIDVLARFQLGSDYLLESTSV